MPRGIYLRTKEHNRKVAEFRKGKKHSEETKHRISIAHLGKISPLRGRKITEEHKRKISLANQEGKFIEKKCLYCNKIFKSFIGRKGKYCSRECFYKTGRHKLSKGNNGYIFPRIKSLKCICKTCGKEFLLCQSAIKDGQGKFCSKECYAKELSIRKKGKNCIFYKHGLSHLSKTERNLLWNTHKYRQWRRLIFKRDNYICQDCGRKKSNIDKLNAHHIKSWVKFPKLRYVVSNGKTLCEKCHRNYIAKYKQLSKIR
jgi:hypothetical protein